MVSVVLKHRVIRHPTIRETIRLRLRRHEDHCSPWNAHLKVRYSARCHHHHTTAANTRLKAGCNFVRPRKSKTSQAPSRNGWVGCRIWPSHTILWSSQRKNGKPVPRAKAGSSHNS